MRAFRILGRNIRDSFKSVFRNFSLSLASISCITITLVLVAVAVVLSYNINKQKKMSFYKLISFLEYRIM